MPEHLFTIGRFSRVTRLSVKALRRYDGLGLLRPAFVDPATGYRRYALAQIGDAELIRLLRELDMPLSEIARLLDGRDDPAAIVQRLESHRVRLELVAQAHQRRLRRLTDLLARADPLSPRTVSERRLMPVHVVSIRFATTYRSVADDVAWSFRALWAAVASAGVGQAGNPLLVLHAVIDEETSGDLEVAVPVAPGTVDIPGVRRSVLPGGRAVVTRHSGPMDEIATAYHVLASWTADHGLEPAGPSREVFLNDPDSDALEALEVEVQWPIRRRRADR